MLPQVQACLLPSREVISQGDCAAIGALVHTVGDVLPEGSRADNRGLVLLLVLPDLIGAAVAGEGPQLLALCGTLAVGGVLLHVVFDQWVLGPAVDGDEDGSRSGGGRAGEGYVAVERQGCISMRRCLG